MTQFNDIVRTLGRDIPELEWSDLGLVVTAFAAIGCLIILARWPS